ncbi:MAG: Lipid-A-disaccharide synthase [Labilithrix sp.]|nr:Lipid-A-disaccharide synthase [Labilithrix sp.]
MKGGLLVSAGEASGDRAGAAVLRHLPGVRAFGLGGGALAAEGAELLCDLADTTAMGVTEVARRAWNVARAYRRLERAAQRRRPAAALLVNYTEFNIRLAESLWKLGTRVLWYGAPQVWAWRPDRAVPLRRHLDRMAVMLPFEEKLWRDVGVDARYVGHPALEERRTDRAAARELLGLTKLASAVGILPGSRPHEVRRLLVPMLAGYEHVRRDVASIDARVLLAPSLDPATRAWAVAMAARADVEVAPVDAHAGIAYALPAFDAALCASGTASLECVLSRVIPVVCYRVGLATELGARMLVRSQRVALPNILLGREAFPELLQRRANPEAMARALAEVLARRDAALADCAEVEAAFGDRRTASLDVARLLEPWLAVRAA